MNKKDPCIIHLLEAQSTNNLLREFLDEKKLEEGTTLVVDNQLAGRGQLGNFWESEPGKNLTFSMVFYPNHILLKDQFILSQAVALSVKQLLEEYSSSFFVKWPNDIYWKEKKIAGILIENDIIGSKMGTCIVGIGLNLNQEEFKSDAPNPISLLQITGKEYNRQHVLERLIQLLYINYERCNSDREYIRNNYNNSLYHGKGYHLFKDASGIFKAKIEKIESDGHLILKTEKEGIYKRYIFKEVTFLAD